MDPKDLGGYYLYPLSHIYLPTLVFMFFQSDRRKVPAAWRVMAVTALAALFECLEISVHYLFDSYVIFTDIWTDEEGASDLETLENACIDIAFGLLGALMGALMCWKGATGARPWSILVQGAPSAETASKRHPYVQTWPRAKFGAMLLVYFLAHSYGLGFSIMCRPNDAACDATTGEPFVFPWGILMMLGTLLVFLGAVHILYGIKGAQLAPLVGVYAAYAIVVSLPIVSSIVQVLGMWALLMLAFYWISTTRLLRSARSRGAYVDVNSDRASATR